MADAKTAAGYDDMTDEQKATFDEEQEAAAAARTEFVNELKTTAGYDSEGCDDNCKALFETELANWEKQKYVVCKDDPNGIACRKADEIKKDEEKRRSESEKNFYSAMTDLDRIEFKTQAEKDVQALEATLTAAFIKDSRPTEGVGRSCGPPANDGILSSSTAMAVVNSLFGAADAVDCPGADECCGIATPVSGGFINDRLLMCNSNA